jgi:hypothetical protein
LRNEKLVPIVIATVKHPAEDPDCGGECHGHDNQQSAKKELQINAVVFVQY